MDLIWLQVHQNVFMFKKKTPKHQHGVHSGISKPPEISPVQCLHYCEQI